MQTIPAKTIIGRTQNTSWFGTDYNMNIYKGCCHGCIYCDSRSDCYQIQEFDTVRAKENAVLLIRDELRKKTKTGVIGTGSMSDPYNPFEEKHRLTRQALEYIDEYHFGISIATKSDLICRDIDLLQRIQSHSPAICKITITTLDDELAGKIEPGACVSSRRFKAVQELSEAGIFTGILMMPLLPGLTDTMDNVMAIIHAAKNSGARFIYPMFGLSLRNGQREYLYQKLDELFPELSLRQTYVRLYGSSYVCHSPNSPKLYPLFTQECKKLGILYKMEEIIAAYKKKYQYQQLSLFQ